jgi:hypothetical protein
MIIGKRQDLNVGVGCGRRLIRCLQVISRKSADWADSWMLSSSWVQVLEVLKMAWIYGIVRRACVFCMKCGNHSAWSPFRLGIIYILSKVYSPIGCMQSVPYPAGQWRTFSWEGGGRMHLTHLVYLRPLWLEVKWSDSSPKGSCAAIRERESSERLQGVLNDGLYMITLHWHEFRRDSPVYCWVLTTYRFWWRFVDGSSICRLWPCALEFASHSGSLHETLV